MSDVPVQVIVAAFTTPDGAGKLMDELKQGKRAGLIGIEDAAVVVKDAQGKLKITDTKRRSRRRKGLITGGVVGGLVGLLAGPVGWAALGGSAIGVLGGRLAGAPIRAEMKDLGSALQPNTSAIVATVKHTWVNRLHELDAALAAEGGRVLRETIKADIAEQLAAGGNVLYTAGGGETFVGAARITDTQESVILATDDGVLVSDAQFTDEQPAEEGRAADESAAVPNS